MSAKQVYERIANGKSGAMPAYKKMLSHEEIQVLADYIKTLPGN
jgi:mono/diheme cytochrome c family protein